MDRFLRYWGIAVGKGFKYLTVVTCLLDSGVEISGVLRYNGVYFFGSIKPNFSFYSGVSNSDKCFWTDSALVMTEGGGDCSNKMCG